MFDMMCIPLFPNILEGVVLVGIYLQQHDFSTFYLDPVKKK